MHEGLRACQTRPAENRFDGGPETGCRRSPSPESREDRAGPAGTPAACSRSSEQLCDLESEALPAEPDSGRAVRRVAGRDARVELRKQVCRLKPTHAVSASDGAMRKGPNGVPLAWITERLVAELGAPGARATRWIHELPMDLNEEQGDDRDE